MSAEVIEQATEEAEHEYVVRREYRCTLKNTHDHKIRVYFLKCTHAEEIHVMAAHSDRPICLLEGLVVVVAFDVERCEFVGGRRYYINRPRTIVV